MTLRDLLTRKPKFPKKAASVSDKDAIIANAFSTHLLRTGNEIILDLFLTVDQLPPHLTGKANIPALSRAVFDSFMELGNIRFEGKGQCQIEYGDDHIECRLSLPAKYHHAVSAAVIKLEQKQDEIRDSYRQGMEEAYIPFIETLIQKIKADLSLGDAKDSDPLQKKIEHIRFLAHEMFEEMWAYRHGDPDASEHGRKIYKELLTEAIEQLDVLRDRPAAPAQRAIYMETLWKMFDQAIPSPAIIERI